MTDTSLRPPATHRSRSSGWLVPAVRGLGWAMIATGVMILLYLVYLLFFTNLQTERAQEEMLSQWELDIGDPGDTLPAEDVGAATEVEAQPVEPGDSYAAMWFERDGERIVHDDVLFVVEGVSLEDLKRGPGHYPGTVEPGEVGNLGISGHRTTHGAPFYHLDQLQEGDTIHVVDRRNREWVYEFIEQRIVHPTDVWVMEDDPLDTGGALLTLTTCHPRLSAAQRMVVFAELVGEPLDSSEETA